MDWLFLTEIVLSGLGSGALLALTGIAFVLIYKATKVLNLAVGEMLMLCAYFFFGLTAAFALPVWLAIILTVIGGGILGGVIERILIRPMLGESPISVFMVTVGLSSVLIGFVEFVWEAIPQRCRISFHRSPCLSAVRTSRQKSLSVSPWRRF